MSSHLSSGDLLVTGPFTPPRIVLPIRCGNRPYSVPRSLRNFEVLDPGALSVRGAAPKWILRSVHNKEQFFIAKRAEMWGEIETYTEFFLNQFGQAMGFQMADSGLVNIDGTLYFASRSFLKEGDLLSHGSVIAQEFFAQSEIEAIGRAHEQNFYSIDFVLEMLQKFCGDAFKYVLPKFVQMLVFDALIGSMDRHIQNWGVIVSSVKPRTFRFAPIFDTARALLWDKDEERLTVFAKDVQAINAYVRRARPCIGILGASGRTYHFDLIRRLLVDFPFETREALKKAGVITLVTEERAATGRSKPMVTCGRILRNYPFSRVFSDIRKKLILAVLERRTQQLVKILKGGCDVQAC